MKVRFPGDKLEPGETAKTVMEHLQELYDRVEQLEAASQKKEPSKTDGSEGAI